MRVAQSLSSLFVIVGAVVAPLSSSAVAGSDPGACCLPNGTCTQVYGEVCTAAGGVYFGDDTSCTAVNCGELTGACCLNILGGTCETLSAIECAAQGGYFLGFEVDCAGACLEFGACCYPGFGGPVCDEAFAEECAAGGGVFMGAFTECVNTNCAVIGACCLIGDGGDYCEPRTPESCAADGGWFAGFGSLCGSVSCGATGACCFDLQCSEQTPSACVAAGGTFAGLGTICDSNACLVGACCYDDDGDLVCDETDAESCEEMGGVYAGPGTNCSTTLCEEVGACCLVPANAGSPVFCAEATAAACEAEGGVFQGEGTLCDDIDCNPTGACCLVSCDDPDGTVCDLYSQAFCESMGGTFLGVDTSCDGVVCYMPCDLPGRPANDGTHDRVLRGFVLGWAVNAQNHEIRFNHLAGNLTVLNYRDGTARQANAWGFPTIDGIAEHGQPTGTPGVLNLDGTEYVGAYNGLVLQFAAEGASAFSGPTKLLTNSNELTLHPVSLDFRDGGQPITTKAEFEVWNENELKFSGAYRCVTCWDQTFLAQYGIPNHFGLDTLQTEVGMARIKGVESALCPGSTDEAILGMLTQHLAVDGMPRSSTLKHLLGTGVQGATIQYTPTTPPQESPASAQRTEPSILAMPAPRGPIAEPLPEAPPPAGADRISGTEKGSLIFFSLVEVRWDCQGNLVQDTFLQIVNDYPDQVRVQLYFVNGDPPYLDEDCGEFHPGWNFVDNEITLTANQTGWWSVLTGDPFGVSPFTVLDP